MEEHSCRMDTVMPRPHRVVLSLMFFCYLWSQVNPESVQENQVETYCHKTYFIQDYNVYEGPKDEVVSRGKWTSTGNESHTASRLSSEQLVAEVNFLHNDLRRERSRRKSLVDFVDNLIRRYSNNSQVQQTWQRYHHKYSVGLDLGHQDAGGEPDTGSERLVPAADRKSERRARKRGCRGGEASGAETKKINGMKSDISSLKNSYSAIYQAYTQLAASHRLLQRETRRYVQQGERLRMFHMAEVQRLGWALANETDLWHAGVQYLMGKISCMTDENRHSKACLDLDPSPRPLGRNAAGSHVMPTGSSAAGVTAEVLHNKLSKSEADERMSKLTRQQRNSPRPTKPVKKPKHVKQPLSFEASLVKAPDAVVSEDGVEDREQGGSGRAGVAVSGALNREQLRESFTTAGLEVFKLAMEQLRQAKPKDCSEIDLWTQRHDPHQTIYLKGRQRAARVYCDDGWTVIQHNRKLGRRGAPGSWRDYRDGFGTPAVGQKGPPGLFWIGNEYIYRLTNQGHYRLKIELGNRGWASYYKHSEYASFRVKSEREQYALELRSGSGTAGDVIGSFSSTPLGGASFATRDRSNGSVQARLAAAHDVGWWYPTGSGATAAKGCFTNLNAFSPWFCDQDGGLTSVDIVVMKIKPNDDERS